ncbi:uncharacterized protein V1510DRAFT_106558 [Dipodascopsis tothii]|uniref:uncharacterized protein n=1 Tax=Dipodascopsis tothii TaxID=44089 RepID=UPI0034CE59EF
MPIWEWWRPSVHVGGLAVALSALAQRAREGTAAARAARWAVAAPAACFLPSSGRRTGGDCRGLSPHVSSAASGLSGEHTDRHAQCCTKCCSSGVARQTRQSWRHAAARRCDPSAWLAVQLAGRRERCSTLARRTPGCPYHIPMWLASSTATRGRTATEGGSSNRTGGTRYGRVCDRRGSRPHAPGPLRHAVFPTLAAPVQGSSDAGARAVAADGLWPAHVSVLAGRSFATLMPRPPARPPARSIDTSGAQKADGFSRALQRLQLLNRFG